MDTGICAGNKCGKEIGIDPDRYERCGNFCEDCISLGNKELRKRTKEASYVYKLTHAY